MTHLWIFFFEGVDSWTVTIFLAVGFEPQDVCDAESRVFLFVIGKMWGIDPLLSRAETLKAKHLCWGNCDLLKWKAKPWAPRRGWPHPPVYANRVVHLHLNVGSASLLFKWGLQTVCLPKTVAKLKQSFPPRRESCSPRVISLKLQQIVKLQMFSLAPRFLPHLTTTLSQRGAFRLVNVSDW